MTVTSTTRMHGRPIIFGEVLFDEFDDGTAVLGGAPFNVAWHLQAFNLQPLFVSRVGKDGLGERVLETMRAWGMDARAVQIDPEHPTGRVKVHIQGGQPSFSILPEQAYDHIDGAVLDDALCGVDAALLYHGSLIARSEDSRAALHMLRAHLQCPCFVDVNLRPPWWDLDTLDAVVKDARWVKLNDHELMQLSHADAAGKPNLEEAARALRAARGWELLVLTRGAAGASLIGADDTISAPPPSAGEVVDTVGAGDAFSSVMILGICSGWPLPVTLERALQFAAAICGIRGATTREHALYKEHLARWDA